MVENPYNLFGLIVTLISFGLLPLFVVTLTSFLKISVVLFLVRNALGIQQTPPNLVLYAIALVLTLYISSPLLGQISGRLNESPLNMNSIEGIQEVVGRIKEPIKNHLSRFVHPNEQKFFRAATERVWTSGQEEVRDDDLMILLPAFVSSELTRAFEIGFLIYLPFLVVDLVISNILMAMGMIMVSPTLISIPLKLFLFVSIDGWSRLMHGLILSYAN